MTIYKDTEQAKRHMRTINQTRKNARDYRVMVDGPETGEVTVMTLAEAQEHGFLYTICW